MQTQKFEAPGKGVWEQDGTHFPRPLTRFARDAFPEGFMKGFGTGTSRFGLLLDHLEPRFVNGFLYHQPRIVGAPRDAKGGPPPRLVFKLLCLLHPEIRGRIKRASTVLQEKPWREDIQHWDTVLKPGSTQTHLRLQAVDLSALSDAQLADHLTECFENSKAMSFQHHVYTISCAIPIGDFMACVQEWTDLPPSEISQALRGSTPISAGVTHEYLAALKAIAADGTANEILKGSGSAGEVLEQLRALPGGTGKAVRTYLDLVSHRIVGGFDVTCPTALETPEILVKSLQRVLSPGDQEREDAEVERRTASVRAAVPEQHRAFFDELLAEARLVNRLRDERSYWSDLWSTGISRRALLEVGRRLAAREKLARAEHLLEASFDEALAFLTGQGAAPAAEELEDRWTYRTTVSSESAPPFLGGEPSPPPPADWFPRDARRTMKAMNAFMGHLFAAGSQSNDAKVVRGISVSTGQYEGVARVIDRIENLRQLQKGEVLVTGSTSTAFNYVLPLVGAIVTDRGGLMSHAAIVAREYGLPGVVGCRDATRSIPNGARVWVDGVRGEVTVLA
jgi:rifampicin phosphotransferase